ncbi:hypothetical protein [Shimia sp. Alg240-R146]|uniref:hypothetical protein n=1 Tax=Shimia sp. Alg240-R146 TaxID=2993449 RepID=UPI0022E8639C|nr:hypothetical protein [Shimia sp. Alg240-R146]
MDLPTDLTPAQKRALGIIAGIGETRAETRAKIRKALVDTLPKFLDAATKDEDLLRKVFVLFEAVAKAGDANRIQCHPLRPEGIDQEVEKLREARKPKAKTKDEPMVKQKPKAKPKA